MPVPPLRPIRLLPVLLLVAIAARADDPPPVQLSAKDDHKRMMDLLGIKQLRPGPTSDQKKANATNIDESKATTYTALPDPLVLKNGKPVTTAEGWRTQRRSEIVEDFDREVYGRVPANTPKVRWEVTATEKQKVGDIEAVTKKLVGHVDTESQVAGLAPGRCVFYTEA